MYLEIFSFHQEKCWIDLKVTIFFHAFFLYSYFIILCLILKKVYGVFSYGRRAFYKYTVTIIELYEFTPIIQSTYLKKMWFMQDGARPQRTDRLFQILEEHFWLWGTVTPIERESLGCFTLLISTLAILFVGQY